MLNLFLLTMIISYAISDCPLPKYPRSTVLGYIEAQLDNNPSLHGQAQQYTYALGEQIHQSEINVVIGIVGMQLTANGHLDFDVQHLPSNQLSVIKFGARFGDRSYGWRFLKFSFIVSHSDILKAGSQVVSQFSVGEGGSKSVYVPLRSSDSFRDSPVVRVFLSGAVFNAQPLDQEYSNLMAKYENFKKFSTNRKLIKLFEEAVEEKKAMYLTIKNSKIIGSILTFEIQTNVHLKQFTFSYLVYSSQILAQKHYSVIGNFGLMDGKKHRVSVLKDMGMLLGGLTSLKIPRNSLFYYHLGFEDSFGQGHFSLMTNLPYLEQQFAYVAFETKQEFVCQGCANSPIIYENRFCVQVCPNGFTKSHHLKNIYCDKCEIDKLKVVDSQTGSCVCAKRHYLDRKEDVCKPCHYTCLTCRRQNHCQTCDNELLQTHRKADPFGQCVCPSVGFYDDKAAEDIVCQKCDPGCVTCSGPRAHHCLTCSEDKQLDQDGYCVCKKGFEVDQISGQCACSPPQVLFKGFCIHTSVKCGPNQFVNYVNLRKQCTCLSGYKKVLNDCIRCEENSVFDQEQMRCKCVNRTVMHNGVCQPCEDNKVYDEITGICRCSHNTFESDDGSCIKCRPKMAYINGKCQCIFNHFQAAPGICRRCIRQSDGPKCRSNQS